MARKLWLSSFALASIAGSAGFTTAYGRNPSSISLSFIRCNAWSGSRSSDASRGHSYSYIYSENIGTCRIPLDSRAHRRPSCHHQWPWSESQHVHGRSDFRLRGRIGDVIHGGGMTPSVAAATAEGDKFRRVGGAPSALTSLRRDIYGRGTISTVSGISGSSDANDKGPPVRERSAGAIETFLPGSRPSEGAEGQDDAAVEHANDGDWKRALQLIKGMRDDNLKPSVTAYVATIEACRRELLFDYASALLRDMFRVCMPEDLFQEYAASHPNDSGVTQTERVFSLLLMMREDGVSPIQETYRAIMGLCSKERLWHLSLLLLEHLRQSGLVPGKFVWDEICTVLFKTGHSEMATMMFEMALEENAVGEETPGVDNGLLDLHHYTASTALAAVRIALVDMIRKPESRGYHDARRALSIVTGMGNNSKDGEAVIKPQVMELLTAMGLEPKLMHKNEGCIVLQSDALQGYIERLTSGTED